MLSEKLSPRTKGLIIGLSITLAVLAIAAVALFGFILPYAEAENTMDAAGIVTITQQDDETLTVQWPAGVNADSYMLQVLQGETVLFETAVTEPQCTLPQLPPKETYTLTIRSQRHYGGSVRQGTHALTVTTTLEAPKVSAPDWTVDTRTGTLYLDVKLADGDSCALYYSEDEGEVTSLGMLEKNGTTFEFGETGDFGIPEYGTKRCFWFELTTLRDQVRFHGKKNVGLQLNREDFLGTSLQLHCEPLPNNAFKLTWNETKGDHYEIHLSEDGVVWSLLKTVERTEPREYTTDHLPPFAKYQLRVTAVGGQTIPSSEFAAEPATIELETKQRVIYSTAWPVKDLQVYADVAKSSELGKLSGGTAFCILEEQDGLFALRYKDTVGYVDSNYCMINLPEYLADICAYDITNSYSSLYLVHEFGIPQVSGTIIKGYEKIDLGGNRFVVPFLYPCAVKLVNAAQAALEQGYRIKIYDSYRPNAATVDIYDKTALILQNPVPTHTFTGKTISDLGALNWTPGLPPAPTDPETGETQPKQPWTGILEGLTYEILMTDNGRWMLANFLAKGGSNHNKGIALDMTLVDMNGFELPMQTRIHDLSWYSESARNNANANLLKKIMTENGFGGLTSEWWHFQDNDARDQLKPPSLYWGVSLQCWVKDTLGWRYRLANGEFVRNTDRKIDGVTYTFDEKGYVTE